MKTGFRAWAAACALLAAGSVGAAGVPGQGTWETTLLPRDINGDSVVDAYYDTALGISWLADAGAFGPANWDESMAWATSLDVHGVAGWRLPEVVDDIRFGGSQPPPSSSEMAHLYYVTLGNIGYPDAGYGPSNMGLFRNAVESWYWFRTLSTNRGGAWFFDWGDGSQDGVGYTAKQHAWAVHDGDVAPPPIPEPATWLLTAAGLAVLAARRARPRLVSGG